LQTAVAALGALTILGSGNLQAAHVADSSVLVGWNIFQTTTGAIGGVTQSVLIGNQIGTTSVNRGTQQSVVIGYQALNHGDTGANQTVIIGNQAAAAATGGLTSSVLIGYQVEATAGNTGLSGSQQNVVIGASASTGINSQQNVLIGYQAAAVFSGGATTGQNVGIGAACIAAVGADLVGQNVVIGNSAQVAPSETLGQNVIIGFAAGRSQTTAGNILLIETNNAGGTAQKPLIFGQFSSGSIVLGNSVRGTSQDLPGTNILKLINGTNGGTPAGGGYFYSLAGNLHWVDTGGFDSIVSFGTGQLASVTGVAFTNNAAAAVGTLTNAPAAGNPTRWIPINDNGTIRNIPAW